MAQCFDIKQNQYVYCSSNFGAYVAIGIILPIAVLIITIVISAYLRYRRRRLRREQQQTSTTTVVPINNTDEEQQPAPYNYSYPPNYTSVADGSDDKPPSYEQTVQQLSEINNTRENEAAILPVTTIAPLSAARPV